MVVSKKMLWFPNNHTKRGGTAKIASTRNVLSFQRVVVAFCKDWVIPHLAQGPVQHVVQLGVLPGPITQSQPEALGRETSEHGGVERWAAHRPGNPRRALAQ